MDEKLLNALNNLSDALTQISDALSEKRSDKDSDVSKALVEGGISDQIKGINEGIKSIKDDTSKILSNQNTIMGMAKSKGDKDDLAAKVGGDKNKQSMIKDGLGVILLMAVAIVALGAAFKLIGDVDFGSVITLGIVIPILALSFVEFQKRIKEIQFDPIKDGFVFILTVTAISLAIVAASYILSMVKPVDLFQLITTVFIAGAFAAISLTIGKLISGFKNISVTDALKASLLMPLVLPAMALAIVGSSLFLGQVQPVGPIQLLTSLAISLLFVPLGFAAGMMLKSFKDINPVSAIATMILIPIVMIGLSYAVVKASEYLTKVKDISPMQFITSLAISVLFIPLGFAAGLLVKMTKGIKLSDVFIIPSIMVLMSTAVWMSSHILSKSAEIEPDRLWDLLLLGITVSAISITLGGAMYLLNKMGSPKDFTMGGVAVLIIATTIMISSRILSLGDYSDGAYPNFDWSLGVGLSLLTFGIATLTFGLILSLTGPIGLLAIAAGGVGILLVAATIVGASHILSKGEYGVYPGIGWSMGVGLSLLGFGLPMLVLGGIIMASLGLGLVVMETGSMAILMIADTIVETSKTLSKGEYGNYPSFGWVTSVGLSLLAFGLPMIMLGLMSSIPFVGGKILSSGKEAIKTIVDTIVDAGNTLSKGNFTGGPTKEWATGVALSIGAFSRVYGILAANTGLIKSGVSMGEFTEAIKSISTGISAAAIELNKGDGFWTGGPTKEWAEGVALSIGAFAKVYEILSANSGWLSSGVSIEDFEKAIQTVTKGIIISAQTFNQASVNDNFWTGGPTKEWAEGVSGAIGAFTGVYKVLSENSSWFKKLKIEDLRRDISLLTDTMIGVGKKFSENPNIWSVYPTTDWVTGIKESIEGMVNFVVSDKIMSNIGDYKYGSKNVISLVDTMVRIGTTFSKNPNIWKTFPTKNWVGGIKSAIVGMANLISDKNLMSKLKGSFYGLGPSPIDRLSGGMYKMAKAYDVLGKSISKFNSSINKMNLEKVNQFRMLTANIAVLSALDSNMFSDMLDTLEEKSSVFAELLKIQYEQGGSGSNVGVTNTPKSSGETDKTDQLIKKVDQMIGLLANIKTNSDNIGDIENQLTSYFSESKKKMP